MTDSHQVDPKTLVTINLKYSNTAEPLRTLAFAQLTAKVLFLAGTPMLAKDIATKCAEILGVTKVTKASIRRGLVYLKEVGHASEHGGSWNLNDPAARDIQRSIQDSAERIGRVLATHFPSDLQGDTLQHWFSESSALVFGRYGDEWVATLSRGTRIAPPRFQPLSSLLQPLTQAHNLSDRLDSLVDGYLAFLGSHAPEDQHTLMNLAQAMFSARLVTADVGADPLTLEEFRSATVILDTNVLFAIALEDHRLAKSIVALGKALKAMDIKPVYLRPSREEYLRTLEYRRREILNTINRYSSEIVSGARDDFLATAIARGCKTEDDFVRFFESLMNLPADIQDGPEIALLEDDQVQIAIDQATQDRALKQHLMGLSVQFRPKWRSAKGEAAANHDAALIVCAERERRIGGNCWILSLDRSLTACAVQRAGPHSLPIVLSADALIEIFSLNGAGPDVSADDFAPLLSRIILNQCEPQSDTYTVEDLYMLTTMNEAASELKPEATQDLARFIARERIKGKTVEDPTLRLEVNRRFHGTKLAGDDALRDAQERARKAEREVEVQLETRSRLEDDVKTERAGRVAAEARWNLVRQLVWRVPLALGIAVALFVLGRAVVRPSSVLQDVTSFGLGSLGLLGGGWKLVWGAVAAYRRGAPR